MRYRSWCAVFSICSGDMQRMTVFGGSPSCWHTTPASSLGCALHVMKVVLYITYCSRSLLTLGTLLFWGLHLHAVMPCILALCCIQSVQNITPVTHPFMLFSFQRKEYTCCAFRQTFSQYPGTAQNVFPDGPKRPFLLSTHCMPSTLCGLHAHILL